jgi:SH3-like domain-containing protein
MDRKWLAGLGSAVLMVTGCAANGGIMRTEEELAQKSGKPLATTVSATVAKDAAVRAGPDKETKVLHQIPAGTPVTASETVARGFRRVTTADGKSGFVDARLVEMGSGGGSSAAPAAK